MCSARPAGVCSPAGPGGSHTLTTLRLLSLKQQPPSTRQHPPSDAVLYRNNTCCTCCGCATAHLAEVVIVQDHGQRLPHKAEGHPEDDVAHAVAPQPPLEPLRHYHQRHLRMHGWRGGWWWRRWGGKVGACGFMAAAGWCGFTTLAGQGQSPAAGSFQASQRLAAGCSGERSHPPTCIMRPQKAHSRSMCSGTPTSTSWNTALTKNTMRPAGGKNAGEGKPC